MIEGYLIFENSIGIVIKYDGIVRLAKTYAPVGGNLSKLCMDIRSAGENATWYCTFTEGIIDPKRGIVTNILDDKNIGVLQTDFDIIKYVCRECGIYDTAKCVSLLDVYAAKFDDTACLYSIGSIIFAAIVKNGVLRAVDTIPFSNYNLYLSKLESKFGFSKLRNMDDYEGCKGQQGLAHLLTVAEWLDDFGCSKYLREFEGSDLTSLDNMDAVAATNSVAEDEYDDEEVIMATTPETRRPVRPMRVDSASRAADLATSVNRVVRDEKPMQDVKSRPTREEQPTQVESRPERPIRPTRVESRPARVEQPVRDGAARPERSARADARPTRESGVRPARPARETKARPRRSTDSSDDEVSHQVHKAKTKQSNTLLVFLIIAVAGMGILDFSNHALMRVYSARTEETISDMRESVEGMNEDIAQNNRVNGLVSSYKTTRDFVK